MTREFKFRAWDNGEMHSVSFNNLHCNNNHPNGKLIIRTENKPFGKEHATVLMQYTGLKDKNGKEIYEGDIVKTHDEDGKDYVDEVIYNSVHCKFMICNKFKDTKAIGIGEYSSICIEIIGNIYENPDLIK